MQLTKRATQIAAVAFATAAVVAGCGGSSAGSSNQGGPPSVATQRTSGAAAAKSDPAPARRSGPSVKAGASDYGRILFDGRRRALYLFTRDSGAHSRCYGAGAAA